MSDPFVGFSPSPKPNPDAKPRSKKLEIELDKPIRDVLMSFSTQAGFEAVFGKTKKFDFRHGAKLSFSLGEKEYRGTISQINIPKRVIVNTEIHGEIEMQFKAQGASTKIFIKARSFLTEAQLVDWEQSISELGQRLEVL
jgi:hypothetical protein